MATDSKNKVPKSSIKQEQNEFTCFDEQEKIKGSKNLNVPPLRFPEFLGEWKNTTIGSIATVVGGGTPDTTHKENWDGEILWYTPTEIGKEKYISVSERRISTFGLKNSGAKLLPIGTILLTSRATIGECSIATHECATNQGFQSLIANPVVNNEFLFYLIASKRKDLLKRACGSTFLEISANEVRKIKVKIPSIDEQNKIASFLSHIDERIATQSKIIEDLEQLRSAITQILYCQNAPNNRLGDIIIQASTRNRNNNIDTVLSVSNRLGFIEQSEQFADRNVASDDTSNYKIVNRNDFAYNPARINVGSIARLTSLKCGIVSPMYICFRTTSKVLPEYLEYFFETKYFNDEMENRLEGSVRLCLSWEGLCNIPIMLPSIAEQKHVGKQMTMLSDKIALEKRYIEALKRQKQYLLSMMFI